MTRASKYQETYPKKLIDLFSKGKDRAHFCASLSIAETTFDAWISKHKEFAEAYEIAKCKAKAWHLDLAYEHLVEHHEGSKINTTLWSMMMRNRFGFTEHRKLQVKGLEKAKTAVAKMALVLKQVGEGTITTNEAQHLAKVIESDARIFETTELERRVAEIEKAQQSGITEDEFVQVQDS